MDNEKVNNFIYDIQDIIDNIYRITNDSKIRIDTLYGDRAYEDFESVESELHNLREVIYQFTKEEKTKCENNNYMEKQ